MAIQVAELTLEERDAKAESAQAAGLTAVLLMAFMPGPVSAIGWIGTVGMTVNGIADAYGHYDARQDNLGERVMSILLAGGTGWLLRVAGVSLVSALLSLTGIGYLGGVMINLAVGLPLAYAVGKTAQQMYRGEHTGTPLTPDQVGAAVRQAYDAAQRTDLAGQLAAGPATPAADEQVRQALHAADEGP
ncbi:MAG TPA: hypothetical protein VKY74_08385 [Chloroflexia bacterium]|nr:hypothetical protein [Chloroflexia bacterium]